MIRAGTLLILSLIHIYRLMPHAYEVLEYLAGKYNLYILSNGFPELQCHKMRSAGIDRFFKKIVLSLSLIHI